MTDLERRIRENQERRRRFLLVMGLAALAAGIVLGSLVWNIFRSLAVAQ